MLKVVLETGETAYASDPLTDLPGMVASAAGQRESSKGVAGFEPGSRGTSAHGIQPRRGDLPSIAELLTSISSGHTSPASIVELALRRIANQDTAPPPDGASPVAQRAAAEHRLGAFVNVTVESARAAAIEVAAHADDPGGNVLPPLAGVPIAHKDIIATSDCPTTAGSDILLGYTPDVEADVVTRLRKAGAISLGKLNTHEFATGVTGTVSIHGPTRNPWNREHVAGGSSCGSAAALAAGLVVAATGTDTGGSIRIPAACCGVVGLKPTYGRVSSAGVIPFAWSLDHVGPMARCVDDVAAVFHVLDRFDRTPSGSPVATHASPQWNRCDHEPSTDPESRPLAGLRFALPQNPLALSEAAVRDQVESAAARLEGLGAVRVAFAWPPAVDDAPRIALALLLAEGNAVHSRTLAEHGDRYQAATREFLARGAAVTGADYLAAQRARGRLARDFTRGMANVDLLVLPTLPTVAPRVDAEIVEIGDRQMDVRAALTLFTRPFNLTGQPALSLRCGLDNGLPVGLQIVGRVNEDESVLSAAAALERSLRGG